MSNKNNISIKLPVGINTEELFKTVHLCEKNVIMTSINKDLRLNLTSTLAQYVSIPIITASPEDFYLEVQTEGDSQIIDDFVNNYERKAE